MGYKGGKRKLAKPIGEILNSIIQKYQIETYYEPFVGSCAILKEIKCNQKFASDSFSDLILMHEALRDGWIPSGEFVTKELYNHLRYNRQSSPYRTFVGIACSFGGCYYESYASNKAVTNFAKNEQNYMIKLQPLIQGVEFDCFSFENLNPKSNGLIYCDPPYEGLRGYNSHHQSHFNRDLFWNKVREWSDRCIVVVSEQNFPDDFTPIWTKETTCTIKASGPRKRREHLVVWNQLLSKLI